ncbi:Crp/Fnr family transcriptional regulator [Paucilactobacillus wasatchensis]|uniref:Transcriptional regulator, Crp/Fnr family n=1 Tax=Paucilactobacillus wasatchensis TaxID=1335616 RepID=A0A0D1A427_9LACO|nr:Crp/Fnr family transcriptional regulator [Paucilactobacillus wasatchensis]KIS02600.1 transcriptional regulator, Crp/Fnr family [Paucilactobacillus wasatchensis]
MEKHSAFECVRSAPIFVGLDDDTINKLTTISTHQEKFPAGTTLYTAGSDVDRLLVIDRGRIKVYRLDEDGQEQILYFLDGHAVDSEAALFTDSTHQNFAETVEDSLVCSIRKSDFQKLLGKTPTLAVSIINAFGNRLTDLENRSARYGTLTAHDRLAQYLEDTAGQVGSRYFKLPLSKRDLANWLSITPETLSRQFAKLTQEKTIVMAGRMITLL